MIKKRSRPQTRVREVSPDLPPSDTKADVEESIPISDLLELRKLKKSRLGIDSTKLIKGDGKRKRKQRPDEEPAEAAGGLRQLEPGRESDEEDEEKDARARRSIRSSNFTQQTNTLDVNKHMMAYIEENLKTRARPKEESKRASDPQDSLYGIADKWKVNKEKPTTDHEGNVTNSMTMLTAIPEVDLGMDSRLKNIEDTERAKRIAAEESQARKNAIAAGEEHLAASRFYQPNLKSKSDADIIRDAKLEAMGLPPQEVRRKNNDKQQVATDEVVMERFKKRMRK